MNFAYEKQVGQKVRLYREKQHMTQEELSAKLQLGGCDITRSALAKMEVGQRHIYLDEFKLLAQVLDVSYEELL